MLNKIKPFNPLSDYNKAINTLQKHNIRPTKQRMILAKLLFEKGRRHISAEELYDEVKNDDRKISLATIYNTIDAFKKARHLKKILTNNNTSYFDTNISSHHHFYDNENNELTDINYNEIEVTKMPHAPKGKKIKDVEVIISLQKN